MSFIWNGVSSDTMKFNVTSRQVYNAPAYDLNAIEVPGRSGDLLNPQNRFKNKQISYTGFLKATDFSGSTWREKLSTGLIQLKGWLCSDAGQYHELTDDYDPGFTRYGYITGETAISDIEDRPFGVTLTVTFNVKPFMYNAGEPMELPETKSASGDIITITDGAENTPLKSAVVNIEPVQDLHGYSYPWPAGGGVNKLPSPAATSKTVNGITIAVNNGVYSISGTATAQAEIIFDLPSTVTYDTQWKTAFLNDAINSGVVFYYRNNTTNGTSMGFSNSINRVLEHSYEQSANKIRFLIASGTAISGTLHTSPMLMLKTEPNPTSFAPYSNTCPISGWSEVNVWVKPTYDTSLTPTATIPLGRTVYGGTLDVVRGKLNAKPYYASYSGQTLVGPWISSHDKYVAGTTPTTGAQVVDMGAAGTDHDVTPQSIKTLKGTNNIWADAGSMEIEYPVPTENPYPFGSRPLYEITMDGTGTLVVNGKEWTITNYTGTLYCDTEAMEWYDASQLRNNIVSGDGWPVFEAGENSVSYTGDITKVMVTPRWRTL